MAIEMIGAVSALHSARLRAQKANEAVSASRRQWEADNAELLQEAKEASELMAVIEKNVRSTAEIVYSETGDKKPLPGVEIKIFKILEYDAAAALEWALEHKLAVIPESLDRKAFESIARAQDIDCVRYKNEIKVAIASDLGKALGLDG